MLHAHLYGYVPGIVKRGERCGLCVEPFVAGKEACEVQGNLAHALAHQPLAHVFYHGVAVVDVGYEQIGKLHMHLRFAEYFDGVEHRLQVGTIHSDVYFVAERF